MQVQKIFIFQQKKFHQKKFEQDINFIQLDFYYFYKRPRFLGKN